MPASSFAMVMVGWILDIVVSRVMAHSGQAAGKNRHPTAGQPVTMSGVLNIDGKKAGNFIAQSLTGPNAGMTGNDIRAGYHGAMVHP